MMTSRISEEQLVESVDGMVWAKQFNIRFPGVPVDDALGWFCCAIEAGKLFEHRNTEAELQQSRALVNELRALAERMQNSELTSLYTRAYAEELTSLLSAHDAQQAEGKGE